MHGAAQTRHCATFSRTSHSRSLKPNNNLEFQVRKQFRDKVPGQTLDRMRVLEVAVGNTNKYVRVRKVRKDNRLSYTRWPLVA